MAPWWSPLAKAEFPNWQRVGGAAQRRQRGADCERTATHTRIAPSMQRDVYRCCARSTQVADAQHRDPLATAGGRRCGGNAHCAALPPPPLLAHSPISLSLLAFSTFSGEALVGSTTDTPCCSGAGADMLRSGVKDHRAGAGGVKAKGKGERERKGKNAKGRKKTNETRQRDEGERDKQNNSARLSQKVHIDVSSIKFSPRFTQRQ